MHDTNIKIFIFLICLTKKLELNKIHDVEGKVKVSFSLEQAMKAQRGSRYIALLFL
jgi:hypothetical protein